MDSLVEAAIEITENLTLSQSAQCGLIGSLCNVTSLELTGFEAKVMLNSKSDTFPTFCNMRTLCLNSCFLDQCELSDKLEALGCFLQNAPCVEELILVYSMFSSSSVRSGRSEGKRAGKTSPYSARTERLSSVTN